MKKSLILAVAIAISVATASYSQTTSGSTPASPSGSKSGSNSQSASGGKQEQGNAAAGQNKQSNGTQPGNNGKIDTRSKQAQQSVEGDGSTRPGGPSGKNANDVGRYSDDDNNKSLTRSKEALERRNKNLTESDTTVKKGSGSARRNTKNHTGVTGNYRNQEIKHNQPTRPRP